MSQKECVIVCTTLPAQADSVAFGRKLVDERLAACVSTQPGVHSVYRWHDSIQENEEQQLLIKTTRDRVSQLEKRLHEIHPYEVPELLVFRVAGGSSRYIGWLRKCTSETA